MSAAVVAAPAVSMVKFRLAGGAQPLMLIPVHVNGRGPFEFICDTGAGTSLLSPELASLLNIERTGSKQAQTAGGTLSVQLAQVDSFCVGEARRNNLEVAIADLGQIGRAVGSKLDGDLGYNFLRHFRMKIDYRTLEMRLEDPNRVEPFGPAPAAEVAMRLAQPSKPLILIEVRVNGRGPFQFAIDTGTSTTAISAELARELEVKATPMGAATTGSAPIALMAARVGSLSVGRAEVRAVDVIIGDFLSMISEAAGTKLDGIVGYNFLRNYKVVIDYPNELFRLE